MAPCYGGSFFFPIENSTEYEILSLNVVPRGVLKFNIGNLYALYKDHNMNEMPCNVHSPY